MTINLQLAQKRMQLYTIQERGLNLQFSITITVPLSYDAELLVII